MLADRVGIIDHGQIVAEGTPSALKAEIGGVSLEATPANPNDKERLAASLARVRRARGRQPEERRGAPARRAPRRSPTSCARSTPTASASSDLQLHQPSLDDVFLEKTGRSLEGADDDEPRTRRGRSRPCRSPPRGDERRRRRAAPRATSRPPLRQVALIARRSVEPHVPPAGARDPGDPVPADPARGERRGPAVGDEAAGLPDRQLHQLRDRRLLRAGRAVRVDHRRHRARLRHPEGLPRPAVADAGAALDGARRRDVRRDRRSRSSARSSTSPSG